MSTAKTVPCVKLPMLPSIPSIKLPLGGELKAFADFSLGPPSDCTLMFSLMAQLTPFLASITCLMKVLGVIAAVPALLGPPPNPLKIPDVLKAIDDCKDCITAVLPPFPNFILTIKGILELIINFLSCLIDNFESLLKASASLDFAAAEGNAALLDSLNCAQENIEISLDSMKKSLEPVMPLIALAQSLGKMAGISLELSLDMSGAKDQLEMIQGLKQKIDSMKQIMVSLPV